MIGLHKLEEVIHQFDGCSFVESINNKYDLLKSFFLNKSIT